MRDLCLDQYFELSKKTADARSFRFARSVQLAQGTFPGMWEPLPARPKTSSSRATTHPILHVPECPFSQGQGTTSAFGRKISPGGTLYPRTLSRYMTGTSTAFRGKISPWKRPVPESAAQSFLGVPADRTVSRPQAGYLPGSRSEKTGQATKACPCSSLPITM